MIPTRENLQGVWVNAENRISITFDRLPFDDCNIIKIIQWEDRRLGRKHKSVDTLLYGGGYFIHENKRNQFIAAIDNRKDNAEIIIQCQEYNEKSFEALVPGIGGMKFSRFQLYKLV